MKLLTKIVRWFRMGEVRSPAARALVVEQYRILTRQIPILYLALIIDSISIAYAMPSTVPRLLSFGPPGVLIVISTIRLFQWSNRRSVTPTAEEAARRLSRMRILTAALNASYSAWSLALFEMTEVDSRALVSLLVYLGSLGSAYCLGSFPSAARLTLLLSALPISLRLMASGDAMLACVGINLFLLLGLLVRMLNTYYLGFMKLVVSRAAIAAQRERARTAEASAERAGREARAAHATLVDALDVIPEGLVVFDAEDRYVLWNRRYAEIFGDGRDLLAPGVGFEDALRTTLAQGLVPDAVGREEEWLRERLAHHAEPQSTHEMCVAGGRWLRIEERRTAGGGSVGVRVDITDLKQREASFRLLFEENPLPMWVVDTDTMRFLAVNAAACTRYGYSREQILSMTVDQLRPPEDREDMRKDFRRHRGAVTAEVTRRHLTADGTPIEVAIESRPLRYQGRDASVAVAFDMTARKEAERRIAFMARHDSLTDLSNRAAFDEYFPLMIDRAHRNEAGFAVLCLDLDRFKEINDLFGHSVGDDVLREICRRFAKAAHGAFLARLGGDEFVVVTAEGHHPSSVRTLAERLQGCVTDDILAGGHSLHLGLSIGIAVFPDDGRDAVTLIGNADAALYRAKHDGRGAIRFFTPAMDRQLRERRALQHDLRSAIEHGELALAYQPQARIDGEITGFEALARWNHPKRGSVPPAEFIPIAEEGGLIVEIGEWVLRQACREAAAWPRPLQVAVNVSAVQFRRSDLHAVIHAILHETGLAPSRLELEITEGVLIENLSRAAATLGSLKALCVRIALDDFGTGHSSLSYLQSFPLDRIKIDRAFVAMLGRTEGSLAIVRAVTGLAHGLNLPVIAEGVETAAQLAVLAREQCDGIQGYLIGRPCPIAAYAELVGRAVPPARPLARTAVR